MFQQFSFAHSWGRSVFVADFQQFPIGKERPRYRFQGLRWQHYLSMILEVLFVRCLTSLQVCFSKTYIVFLLQFLLWGATPPPTPTPPAFQPDAPHTPDCPHPDITPSLRGGVLGPTLIYIINVYKLDITSPGTSPPPFYTFGPALRAGQNV